MSYNVDSIEIVYSAGFRLSRTMLNELRMETSEDERPESSFLDEDWDNRRNGDEVPFLWWNGDGSGHTYEKFIELLARFDGFADLVICWEGGDSYTGLRLAGHVVTGHEVVMTLGEVKP